MSIHVALNHVTHYRYDRPINLGPQVVRLRPAPHSRTRVLSYSMRVEPATHFINWQQDPFSPTTWRGWCFRTRPPSFTRRRWTWWPRCRCYNPFDFFLEPHAQKASRLITRRRRRQELAPYLAQGRGKAGLQAGGLLGWRSRASRSPRPDFLVALNQKIQK